MTNRHPEWYVLGILGSAAGCADYSITEKARCDGALQPGEEAVDSAFDRDGDGFFDSSNPDCQNFYEPEFLDCDDGDEEVNPGAMEVECDLVDNDCDEETADSTDLDEDGYDSCDDCADSDGEINPGSTEIECNGVDDDCDEDTTDADDLDGDGWNACDDCDDASATAFPDNEEICEDYIDNNCNGETDEGCPSSYTGMWMLSPSVSFSCAFGLVSVNLSSVNIYETEDYITIGSNGSQPGSMSSLNSENSYQSAGVWSDGHFVVTNMIAGSCNEYYTMSGDFTDPENFEATLTVDFEDSTGSGFCFDCTSQIWTMNGIK
jgi:hypothetical protein